MYRYRYILLLAQWIVGYAILKSTREKWKHGIDINVTNSVARSIRKIKRNQFNPYHVLEGRKWHRNDLLAWVCVCVYVCVCLWTRTWIQRLKKGESIIEKGQRKKRLWCRNSFITRDSLKEILNFRLSLVDQSYGSG